MNHSGVKAGLIKVLKILLLSMISQGQNWQEQAILSQGMDYGGQKP